MLVESAIVASLLAIASLWWIGAIRSPRRRGLAVGAVALAAASTLWASIGYRHESPLEAQVRDRPIEEPLDGYVSSTRCRACHAAEHAAWARSYHRAKRPTSIQLATDNGVVFQPTYLVSS